jgi:hypothetical protein
MGTVNARLDLDSVTGSDGSIGGYKAAKERYFNRGAGGKSRAISE